MKKLQFKTNSRHISQLGRELVTDFVTALVELIKNSYDADAYGVKIILDKPNTPQSRIVLIDTGTGMTQSDFENKWMVIGTNNKITEPYTPKGRKKAGKKGIGRFSVERLAEKVQIYSFPEFEPPYRVDINWNSFEEINIPALTQRIGILKDHQESTAAKFICNQLEYFMVTDKILQEDKDTVESILGTKSFEYPMFYKNETLRLLEDKVVPIIKKYEDIELLIGDVSSSLDTIDSQSESEVFTMLEELYIKFNLSKSQTGKIGDETNPLLIDATNREGIIENEAYSQLVSFLSKCTNLISDVRRKKNAILDEENSWMRIERNIRKIDKEFSNHDYILSDDMERIFEASREEIQPLLKLCGCKCFLNKKRSIWIKAGTKEERIREILKNNKFKYK